MPGSGARIALLKAMSFFNRSDAGRQLAGALHGHVLVDPIVIGISRGGVPVAAEVARVLGLSLEICIVRRLVAPGDPPITIGAVAEGGAHYTDEARIRELGLSRAEVDAIAARQDAEVTRLGELLRDEPPLELRGRDTFLVDDGAITGGTIRASVRSLRMRGARRIELAVPVGNSQVIGALRSEVDGLVCLVADPMLVAIGARYDDFGPVSEAEVVATLADARRRDKARRSRARGS